MSTFAENFFQCTNYSVVRVLSMHDSLPVCPQSAFHVHPLVKSADSTEQHPETRTHIRCLLAAHYGLGAMKHLPTALTLTRPKLSSRSHGAGEGKLRARSAGAHPCLFHPTTRSLIFFLISLIPSHPNYFEYFIHIPPSLVVTSNAPY